MLRVHNNRYFAHNKILVLMLCVVLLAAPCVFGARVPLTQLDDITWLDDALLQEQAALATGKRSNPASLWFGPRLGRRRRSPPEDEELTISEENALYTEAMMELLRDRPLAVIALREYPSGKRQTLSFTPRLGRVTDMSNELLSSMGLRSPPFSPRLGRGNGLPFSPRLGREQEQQQQVTTTSRIGRNVDQH